LRSEVKRAKDSAAEYRERLDALMAEYDYMVALWGEFDCTLLRVADVALTSQKIAGVRIPILEEVKFECKPFDLFTSPAWFSDGIELLKKIAGLGIEFEVYNRRMALLDYARRKTTQKVNLYEKVQIPGYEDAIRKIKRFMEDEENLSKSAQKIVKTRQQAAAQEGGKR
jgi:V/A-type H+-transporting ATPase subunit D